MELLADKVPVSVTLIQPTAVNTPYPEHARNYMDKEAKLPTPPIDPMGTLYKPGESGRIHGRPPQARA